MKNELDCVYKGKEFKLKKNSPTYLSIKYLSIKDDKSDKTGLKKFVIRQLL